MLYVLHGTHTQKARDRLHAIVRDLLERKPNAEYFRLEGEEVTPATLSELIEGQGLFERKYIVVLDRACEDEKTRAHILPAVERMAQSNNVFILFETVLDPEIKKAVAPVADKEEEVGKHVKKDEFNIFSLTDSLGKRERKKAWILYHDALRSGVKPEEVYGKFVWLFKTIILVHTSKDAREAGMKPYPYKKAHEFCSTFSLEEARASLHTLIDILAKARRGNDLKILLERFILTL